MQEFTSTVGRFADEKLASLWHYHLEVPQAVSDAFAEVKDRRVVVTYANGHQQHCALMPNGQGGYYIFLNAELRKKLKVDEGDSLTVAIEEDTSEYGMPLPEELQVLLDQDDEGREAFHKLTPGKQRTLIYWVGGVKNPEKRMTKALVMINHVRVRQGQVDFKALNADYKAANER